MISRFALLVTFLLLTASGANLIVANSSPLGHLCLIVVWMACLIICNEVDVDSRQFRSETIVLLLLFIYWILPVVYIIW